jgi:hypothetical protein
MAGLKWFAPVLAYLGGAGAMALTIPHLPPNHQLVGVLIGVFFPTMLACLMSYHIYQTDLYVDEVNDEEIIE